MFKRTFQRDAVFVMALYNIVVGALFFFLYSQIFKLFGIAIYTPVHAPTIQIPCLFLIVFGIGYLYAAYDMVRNRALLLVGLLQNAAVIGIAVWYKINEPQIVHDVYLIPAGLSALFAIVFLIALIGSMIEGGRQRRRRKAAGVGPTPEETAPETAEETPKPRESETPSGDTGPEEDPLLHSLAHRDRSGIHIDEPPTPPESA